MPYAKDHKAKSKNRILNTAIELFSRYGFDKVSIGQIMRSAKMTHGAFYAHFESKEALFKASFIETLNRSRAARLVKGPLSIEHLTNLVTHCWSLCELGKAKTPGPEMVLFNEVGNNNTSIKQLFNQSYDNLKKIIEIRLVALSKLKQLPINYDREAIADKARVILSIIVGAVVTAKTIPQQEEQRRVLESAQNQILTMLGVNMVQRS